MANHNTESRFCRELLPVPRIFFERELGKLSRPSRGWARGNCPFHQSQSKLSFSVNLDGGGFFCHGCGVKGGDVVAFMRLRYSLSFKAACIELGCWNEQLSPTLEEVGRLRCERQRQQAQEAEQKESDRQQRIEARAWLHAVETLYDEAIAEHFFLLGVFGQWTHSL